ncbi:MAG: glutathione S-transferase family protein [Proteobacteria bacterium]|nr:glutathione S-transferase family protein [Pseudomonadota bacterium]MDA1298752.1 glutathione S-transferase family protein [Pseudomonadota bacterium]
MLKLYGFPMSNYFNMVKMALLEKGVDFEVITTSPSQQDDYLSKSPMGKVPCLETPQGFLSETSVILEYLEDTCPSPALFPADPFEKAKVRELMKQLELYIELPARTLFAEAFFGGKVSDAVKEKATADLAKGVAAVRRNARFSPYVAGSELTYADLIFMYSVNLAGAAAKRVLSVNLLDDFPEAKVLMGTLNERPSAKQVAADQAA